MEEPGTVLTDSETLPSGPETSETSTSETSTSETSTSGTDGIVESEPAVELVVEPKPDVEMVIAVQPKLTQEDVDQSLEEVMESYSAVAVSVAAIEAGQVTQSGAWGWAVKDQREMTPDTKLRVASLSKVAVGMCAMAMAEDGYVDLDAPLSDYWGGGVGNPYTKAQPSVRTLMSHSSSVKSLDIMYGLSKIRGLLQSGSTWRSAEPGDGGYWYYNNFGFCVLGTTLELAWDGLLDDYFQERFVQPMDIRATFCRGKLEEEELASLYSTGGLQSSATEQAGERVPQKIGEGASYYPGGLTISAVDMAKLVSILAGDGVCGEQRYLEVETVAAMETPQFRVELADTVPFDQCLVLRRQEDVFGQEVLCYHTGSAYGVFSLLSYNPETGDGVVVLTTGTKRQTEEHDLYALCADLSAALYEKMQGVQGA